jgi:hypothetical protein
MKRFTRTTYMLALTLAVGCNSGSNNTAQNGTAPNQATAAAKPIVVDAVGTEPGQAVAVFLDSLRRGDEKTANGVLTTMARQEVQKTNYQIQPPGSPDGKYEIGRVAYLPENSRVALVECQWTDPAPAGQKPEVTEIVCEVHQETDGWRISGIGFKLPGVDELLTIDFENANSLNETIDAATAALQQNKQPTGATQAEAAQIANPAMPPLPNGQTQIALPPINNAPVQR